MARIIVVERDPEGCDAIATYLTQVGHVAFGVGSGWALQAALAGGAGGGADADLVLIDPDLPGEDGRALVSGLVASGIAVIVATASADVIDRIILLEMGAADVLVKPLDLRELSARIAAVLRHGDGRIGGRGGAGAGPASLRLRFETALADLRLARVLHDDGRIDRLTHGEVALLRVLAEAGGRVLSRDEVLRAAPAETFDAFDQAVDARIARLRAKLATAAIATVRGAGYRLDPVDPRPR